MQKIRFSIEAKVGTSINLKELKLEFLRAVPDFILYFTDEELETFKIEKIEKIEKIGE